MLSVLSVAYPLAPVGFDTAGGSEQVLALIDHALVSEGHRSIVVGCAGSAVRGELFADSARQQVYETYRDAIRMALEANEVDVIHLHGVDANQYLPPDGASALITLHLPVEWYSPQMFTLNRPHTYLNCVSPSQQRTCPPCPNLVPYVENGIPVEAFPFSARKREFVLVLARVCP